jgi:uncharacterized protein YbjT (DUF2867 family)
MKVLIFGATGMVGQGVLRESLLDPEIEVVQTVGRTATGIQNAKLREVVHANLFDYTGLFDDEGKAAGLQGFDACFFCLGVSSAGMGEADYARLTFDLTLASARVLAPLNPRMPFVYVSGKGTNSSEQGRVMWARVKGRTENALLRLPFKAAYFFRPGAIQAMHGERPKVAGARALYNVLGGLLTVLRRLFPNQVLTTEQIGRAMINVSKRGWPKPILESSDIRAAAK